MDWWFFLSNYWPCVLAFIGFEAMVIWLFSSLFDVPATSDGTGSQQVESVVSAPEFAEMLRTWSIEDLYAAYDSGAGGLHQILIFAEIEHRKRNPRLRLVQ